VLGDTIGVPAPSPPRLLIGRSAVVADVLEALRRYPVVALLGPGGVGKTAIAAEASNQVDRDVTWLDLGSLAEPSDVLASVSTVATGRPEAPRLDIVEALRRADRLFVLDTCEHLVDAVAVLLGDVLGGPCAAHFLATSRRRLGLKEEFAIAVPPLSVEPVEGGSSASAEMFAIRATQARGGRALSPGEMRAAEQICRSVGGLPLGIEIAAARCRAMAVEEVAALLAEDGAELTSDRRGEPARHQSLQASVEWSWQLLTPPESEFLAALSVLPDWFDIQTAAAAAGVGPGRAATALARLVDHSLLQPRMDGDETEYHVFDAVAEFVREATGEGVRAEVIARLRAWMLTYPGDGSSSTAAVPRLEQMLPLLRLVLDATRGTVDGVALALAAMPVWGSRRPHEGLLRLDRAANGVALSPSQRIATLSASIRLAAIAGDASLAVRAAALLEVAGDDERARAAALNALGRVALLRGEATEAESHYRNAAEAWFRAGDLLGHADALASLAEVAMYSADLLTAREATERALAIGRSERSDSVTVRALVYGGAAAHFRSAFDVADSMLAEARAAADASGEKTYSLLGRAWSARLMGQRGDPGGALAEVEEIRRLAQTTGVVFHDLAARWARCMTEDEVATAPGLREDPILVASTFETWGFAAMAAETGAVAVRLHLETGDLKAAVAAADRAVGLGGRESGRAGLAMALLASAQAALALGRQRTAAEHLLDAVRVAESISDLPTLLAGLEQIAIVRMDTRPQLTLTLEAFTRAYRERVRIVRPVWTAGAVAAAAAKAASLDGGDLLQAAVSAADALSLAGAAALARRGWGRRRPASFGWDSLTESELEVIRLLGRGLATRDIAERLVVSPETVKTHVKHIFQKLGVHDRAAVVAVAAARREEREGSSSAV